MSLNPSLGLVDTHCHLNLNEFDSDRLQVVEQARQNGILRILVPGLDVDTSRLAIELSHQFPEVYVAVGVHPNSDTGWTDDTLAELEQLAGDEKVVAIGEIGLDYYRDFTPRPLQLSMFQQQLELAAEMSLPVVIHNRDASDDVKRILINWCQDLERSASKLVNHPGVLHSFSAAPELGASMVRYNFKLGIAGPVTFRSAQRLQSVVISMPLENLLVETDAPYQTPNPYRGKRNEPANVRIVAEKIAELKQCTVEMVARTTTSSADDLFRWRDIH